MRWRLSMNAMNVTIDSSISFKDVEDTLRLARLAVESIYGVERPALEAHIDIDRRERRFVFDTSRRVGRTLALVFCGYARREFGPGAMQVEHAVRAERTLQETV